MNEAGPPYRHTCPLPLEQVVDRYFMAQRAKLLDIAAFLDRTERAADGGNAENDPRLNELRKAIGLLIDGKPQRAKRMLEAFSDPTDKPIYQAPGKGAVGVYLRAGSRA